MTHPLLIIGIVALILQVLLVRGLVKQGRKNASKIYPPARMKLVYRKKLINEMLRNG